MHAQHIKKEDVVKTMRQVADWQVNDWDVNQAQTPKWDWTNATGYIGILEMGDLLQDNKYHSYLYNIGEELKWDTGPNRFYADDYCIAQTFIGLYLKKKEKRMINKFIALADSIVKMPHTESLEWKNEINHREWAWCDALFMGPPTLAKLSIATGNKKYLAVADKLWWKTYDYLYDKEEHLYFRDGSNFTKRERNGKEVFWSRGNGWVMAGLSRVITDMPLNYPSRHRYVSLYKEMAEKIVSLQQADGSWHTSLLDPASYPLKETSGTAFYTYALLWGLNNGILDKSKYWPVVMKSWGVLVSAIHPNGMLGYVQPIGWQPEPATPKSTAVFGVGAFLLAGAELYKYIDKNNVN
ncbi:glycoside hydrolase family 88 protein [Pedobacter frigiditerrae]|uniref:Glycoside hydrolase family 88 protein n=1 Tax=Pedobacter frigiditerrae TaxID=2530452 RepID=A0A4V2MI33_9SPHI|nr:glycoside hydrolase family 88 protein [Pedobacter frigiditerrae]